MSASARPGGRFGWLPNPPGLVCFFDYSESMFPRYVKAPVLRFFAWIEKPAAWGLLIGAIVTFVSVIFGWLTVGDFKWPTLLIAADLMVSGFTAVQESQDEDDEELAEQV